MLLSFLMSIFKSLLLALLTFGQGNLTHSLLLCCFQVSNTEEPDEMPLPDSESVYVIPGSILLWKITPRPPNSAQVSYASAY